jgi:hypothetical protein
VEPDFPDSEPPKELSAEKIAELFAAVEAAKETGGKVAELQTTLRGRAAVLGAFTPHELQAGLPSSPELEEAVGMVLDVSTPITQDEQQQWLLDPSPRRETLTELGPEQATSLLESLPTQSKSPSNSLSSMIAKLIRNRPPRVSDLRTTAELRNLVNAAQWCEPASPAAASGLPSWRVELLRRELEEPFTALIGGRFVGREAELKALRNYVNIVPPSDKFEGWSRWLSDAMQLGVRRPIVVHGIGGIGKSTLMAHFILEHAAVRSDRAFPFVYLDFDRSSLDPRYPATLVMEAARQLEAQFPEKRALSADLQSYVRDELRRSKVEQRAGSILSTTDGGVIDGRVISKASARLIDFLKDAGLHDRPFLLVLDTFEEVQAKGNEFVDIVFDWLSEFSSMASLRTVIAGRAPIEDRSLHKTVRLGNLGQTAALAFLEYYGVEKAKAQRVYEVVGGNPLSLRLAIRLVRSNDFQRIDPAELKQGWFGARMTDVQIQGYLQTRLLKHIRDPNVRKLAHPGLVLRRITKPIIRDVLAPIIGLRLDEVDEQRLYDGLRREVSIVSEDHDALVHRKDVRAVMLELQRAKEPELFTALNNAALKYYAARRGTASDTDPTELAYHELMLGHDPVAIVSACSNKVLQGLGSAIDELPRHAALIVRLAIGHAVSKSEVKKLSDMVWSVYAYRRAIKMTTSGSPENALEVLAERSVSGNDRLLAFPRAVALFQTLQWRDADSALAFASSARVTTPFRFLDTTGLDARAAVEHAFLKWYQFRDAEARAAFQYSLKLSGEIKARMPRIESLVGTLSVAGDEPAAQTRDLLRREMSEVSTAEWRQNLLSLRRVVFLGQATEAIAAIALDLLGLRLRSIAQLGAFVDEFGDDLDPSIQRRIALTIGQTMSRPGLHTADNARVLSALEADLAAYIPRSSKDLARRVLPFVRGQFAPWRVPMRTAIMGVFRKPETVGRLLEKEFPDVHLAVEKTRTRNPRSYVEDVIEVAEDHDLVLPLLRTCIKERDREDDGAAKRLLRALERYTAPVENARASRIDKPKRPNSSDRPTRRGGDEEA